MRFPLQWETLPHPGAQFSIRQQYTQTRFASRRAARSHDVVEAEQLGPPIRDGETGVDRGRLAGDGVAVNGPLHLIEPQEFEPHQFPCWLACDCGDALYDVPIAGGHADAADVPRYGVKGVALPTETQHEGAPLGQGDPFG